MKKTVCFLVLLILSATMVLAEGYFKKSEDFLIGFEISPSFPFENERASISISFEKDGGITKEQFTTRAWIKKEGSTVFHQTYMIKEGKILLSRDFSKAGVYDLLLQIITDEKTYEPEKFSFLIRKGNKKFLTYLLMLFLGSLAGYLLAGLKKR